MKPRVLEKFEEALLVDDYDKQGKNVVTVNSASKNTGNHKQVQLYGSGDGLNRKKMNPLGSDGRPLLCRSCGSYRHLVANCPHSRETMNKLKVHRSDNNIEDQQLVLLSQHLQDDDTVQNKEHNNNYAVLDSACSSTVCVENWLNKYQASLSMCNKIKAKRRESRNVFEFGDGCKLKSIGEY